MDKETQVLQNIIEKYISKKLDLVQKAQIYSKKINDYGFIEPGKTLPFQILPTEFFDEDGDVVCKLFVNLEHPMYGMFSIELLEDKCAITCPNIYIEDFFVMTHEEFEKWIDLLDSEMNEFYLLSGSAEEKNYHFCELSINDQLSKYKNLISPFLDKIKYYINNDPRTAIVSNHVFALVKNANKDFSKALLLPSAWVVFKDLDNLPDDGENFENYIDEEATEKLFNKLQEFFRIENYYAAPIYLAQRICLQGECDVRGYSVTEDEWQEAKITEELGEFVLPPIDIKEFEID
jgi:hypothetical protein